MLQKGAGHYHLLLKLLGYLQRLLFCSSSRKLPGLSTSQDKTQGDQSLLNDGCSVTGLALKVQNAD